MFSNTWGTQNNYEQINGGRNWVYWMYVVRDGRPTVLGYKQTLEEANAYLYQNAPNEGGEVVCLDTINLSDAVRKIKSHILETSHSLDEATIRMVRKQFKPNKPKKKKVDKELEEQWRDY